MGLLTDEVRARLKAMADDPNTAPQAVLAYLAKWVLDEVERGQFTEEEAQKDLEVEIYMGASLLACREFGATVKLLRMLDYCRDEGIRNAQWCYLVGSAHLYLGELDEALTLLSRSVELDPQQSSARAHLIRLLAHFGRQEEAEAQLAEALALFPNEYELQVLSREVKEGADLITMLLHYTTEAQDRELHRHAASAEYDRFALYLSTVLVDEAGLKAIKEAFSFLGELQPAEGDPHCLEGRITIDGVAGRGSVQVPVVILGNEAGISHWEVREVPNVEKLLRSELPDWLKRPDHRVSVEISLNGMLSLQAKDVQTGEMAEMQTLSTSLTGDKGLTLREAKAGGENISLEVETVLEKCAALNAEDRYQEIIDLLEEIPAQTRSPLLTGELARAYNNRAVMDYDEDDPERAMLLRRSIELLASVRETESQKHSWQFRLGYAFYYLGREEQALPFFKQALALRPGDEDTIDFINRCLKVTSLPITQPNMADRVHAFWRLFGQSEAHWREALRTGGEAAATARKEIRETLHEEITPHWPVEVMVSEEQISIVIGALDLFWNAIMIDHLRQSMPKRYRAAWRICTGLQVGSIPESELTFNGQPVALSEMRVWLNRNEENEWKVSFFHPIFDNLPPEKAPDAFEFINHLLGTTFGEAVVLRWFRDLGVKRDAPKERTPDEMAFQDFVAHFKATEPEVNTYTMDQYLYDPVKFTLKPQDVVYPLYDIEEGETWCMMPLIGGFYNNDNMVMHHLRQHGATAGVLGFAPKDELLEGKTREAVIAELRRTIEKTLKRKAPKSFTVAGYAIGKHWGYLFLLLWNPVKPLSAAHEFANSEESPVKSLFFRSFYTFANPIFLKDNDEGEALVEQEADTTKRNEERAEKEKRAEAAQQAEEAGLNVEEMAPIEEWNLEDLDPNRTLN